VVGLILTLKTLVVLLMAAIAGGAAVYSVSNLSPVSGDAGSDYGLDTDGNGRFDWLVVEATVNLPEAGTWSISAGLMTSTPPTGGICGGPYPVPLVAVPGDILPPEWSIAWTYEVYFFPAGTQTVRMAFQGTDIFRAGVDGPYLVRATLSLGTVCPYCRYEAGSMPWFDGHYLMWNYTTQAYQVADFQEPFRPAYFTGGHTDSAVDVDEDGLFDFLELRADIRVNAEGTYNLNGVLSATTAPAYPDPSMPVVYTMVAYAYRDVSLQVGDTSVHLRFRGDQIRMANVDGPWDFSLTMYGPVDILYLNGTVGTRPPGDGFAPMPMPVPETLCGTTAAYRADAFDDTVELLAYTGVFEEIVPDRDGDGLYDLLEIRAGVDVFAQSGFDIRAILRSGDGKTDIASFMTQMYLPEGLGLVAVAFDGAMIRANGIDGPYQVYLSITPTMMGFDPETTYATRVYRAADFDEGCLNCSGHWIGDLAARPFDASGMSISVSVVRGDDMLTYVIEDLLTVSVIDASGSTVWSVVERVYLPSGGVTQYFGYDVRGLSAGTYLVVATLGPPERPIDVRSTSVTL